MEPYTNSSVVENRLCNPSLCPSGHIIQDPATGLSHPYLPDVRDDTNPSNSRSDTIIVSIHGASKRNGQAGAKAAYSLFFGEASKFNTANYLPKAISHKSQSAQLYACQRAIEVIEDVVIQNHNANVKTVIIKTDSSYLVKCLSKFVFDWEQNGYLNVHGNPLINRIAIEKIHSLLVESVREDRARYQFWLVDIADNSDAITLAKGVYESETSSSNHAAQYDEPWEAALLYWTEIAHSSGPARNLCRRLGIQLRKGVPGTSVSITPPIRRLVVTGEDRPANFALLFGAEWKACVLEEWKRIRAEVLETARKKTKVDELLDIGMPWYRPRVATAAELGRDGTLEGGVRLNMDEDKTLEDWVHVLTIED